MENMKPLFIPKSKRIKGLGITIYCYACKRNVSDECKETEKSLKSCPNADRHIIKQYIQLPNSDTRITKRIDTRDIDEAIKIAIDNKREVKENKFVTSEKRQVEKREYVKTEKPIPFLLIEKMAQYSGFLNNENVPAHLKKERTLEHIKDVERVFKLFCMCLKENGHNYETFQVGDLNDTIIGEFHSYLIDVKKYSNRSYNKSLSYFTTFTDWMIEDGVEVKNYFKKVNRKRINPQPESINKEGFDALLNQINQANGSYFDKSGKKRNLYRSWLKDAFRLALETGRRREEIISLKFSNVVTDKENNNPIYLKCDDIKVNRQQGRVSDDEKKIIYIPITKNLQTLLNEMGYENYKGTNEFILAPEIKSERTRVMADNLSKAFAIYYKKLNTGNDLSFRCLRKTYISGLSVFMGGNAKAISGHSDNNVIERFYLDKAVLAKAAQGFEVFPANLEKRNQELNSIRDSKSNQISLEK